MANWKKTKNITLLNNRYVDVAISGSNISKFVNDVGYITSASASGSYASLSDFNTFTSSYYVDSASFDSRINSISFDTSSLVTTSSFNSFTSSYYAVSASFANSITSLNSATGSYILSSQTSSMTVLSASYAISSSHEIIKEVSSSYADTASFAQSGNGIFSGSFSGSFVGDGSGLTGVPTGSDTNIANSDLTITTTGDRILKLGGNLQTDTFKIQKNNGAQIASFHGDGLQVLGLNNSGQPRIIINPASTSNKLSIIDASTGNLSFYSGTTATQLFSTSGLDIRATGNGKSIRFINYDASGNALSSYWFDRGLHFGLGETHGGDGYIAMKNHGTPPTTDRVDKFVLYPDDQAAGNTAPHFRTELGQIVKLYRETEVTSSQGIADALANIGLLNSGSIIPDSGFPYVGSAIISGSLIVSGSNVDFTLSTGVSGSFSGSFVGDGSGLTNLTLPSGLLSGSYATTGSNTFNGDQYIIGDITASKALISSSAVNILEVQGSGSSQPLFKVVGSQGELFSVTDELSGSLFAVNNSNGDSILDIQSDNRILFGDPNIRGLLTTTSSIVGTSSTIIYNIPTASYNGAWFEYTISSASNARAGQIMSIWNNGNITSTETTTLDLGNTTGFGFEVIITGSNTALTGSATTEGWTVNTIIKSI